MTIKKNVSNYFSRATVSRRGNDDDELNKVFFQNGEPSVVRCLRHHVIKPKQEEEEEENGHLLWTKIEKEKG